MSIDTYIQLRTSLSVAEVTDLIVNDPEIADLGLVSQGGSNGIVGQSVGLVIRPWQDDDHHLFDQGFRTGSMTITVVPRRGPHKFEAEHRAIAAVLRLIPGDACVANQNADGPDLIRLDGMV